MKRNYEQMGRDDAYHGRSSTPPERATEDYLRGVEYGWEDYWIDAQALCAEMALTQDTRRRAS